MKFILLLTFFFIPILSHTQNETRFSINSTDITSLALSEIAEKVIPVPLSKYVNGIQFIHITDEFIFLCDMSAIFKFDFSGNLVKIVDCKGGIKNMTGDMIKKEIYIVSGESQIKSYDYSLNNTHTYIVKYNPTAIYFHKEKLWIQSFYDKENVTYHEISYLNLITGKETFLNFNSKIKHSDSGDKGYVITSACFSAFNDQLIFAFPSDNIIYTVKNDRISVLFEWNILSTVKLINENNPVFSTKGFMGKYLFINYSMNDLSGKSKIKSSFIYIKDTNTRMKYNILMKSNEMGFVEGAICDDIYKTGYFTLIYPCNGKGYFYFIKGKNDIDKNINKVKISDGQVIFIVKTKE